MTSNMQSHLLDNAKMDGFKKPSPKPIATSCRRLQVLY